MMSYLANTINIGIFDNLDLSAPTKSEYLSRLPYFAGFVSRHGITHELLLQYKNHLRAREDLGVASKNKYLAVARISLRELYRQGKISKDLSVGVKSFRQSKLHKVVGHTSKDVERVVGYLRSMQDNSVSQRQKAMIALLFYQGLRQVEICRLNVEDVDLLNKTILVQGKGIDDKEPIHLHPHTHFAITAYLRSNTARSGALFVSRAGRSKGSRLSTRGLRYIVIKLFHSAGVYRTVHGARHFFTTRLIRQFNGDLLTVARFTRHSSLDMLVVYNDELRGAEDFRRFDVAFGEGLRG